MEQTKASELPVLPPLYSIDRLAGLEAAGSLGALDHRERHPVLVRAGRVGCLELDPDLGHARLDDAREPHDRRVADDAEGAGTLHRQPSSVARPGSADVAQAELLVLAGLRDRRRLEHRVGARLGLREGHDLADVGLEREQRRPAVDAEGDPAVRRRAVVEGVEDGPELLAHPLERVALELEAALEQVAAMDPDRAAAELPAVEREVVLERPGAAGRVLGRRAAPDRRTR